MIHHDLSGHKQQLLKYLLRTGSKNCQAFLAAPDAVNEKQRRTVTLNAEFAINYIFNIVSSGSLIGILQFSFARTQTK